MTPHAFKGRSDRWCEICNLPDRDPIHKPVAPGPWNPCLEKWRVLLPEESGEERYGVAVVAPEDVGYYAIVEEVGQEFRNDKGESVARLIAAAPELLEALKGAEWKLIEHAGWADAYLCPTCHNNQQDGHTGNCAIGNALAKAEGRS